MDASAMAYRSHGRQVNGSAGAAGKTRIVGMGWLMICVGLLTACATSAPFPVERGSVMTLTRPGESPAASDPDNLRVTWLGTSSFHIRLGDNAILTDPFYSHHSLARTAFGRLETNEARVRDLLQHLLPPSAIFIGHSHYDHLMDTVPAIRLNGWTGVEVIGGKTTGYLLDTWPTHDAWSFNFANTNAGWQSAGLTAVSSGIEYMATRAEHAPQVGSVLVFPDALEDVPDKRPTRASQYPLGEPLAYLFRLRDGGRSHTIFFVSAATSMTEDMYAALTRAGPVHIAILCVPSWQKADGYPEDLLDAIRPRTVILSHFNDFFSTDPEPQALRQADLAGFLRRLQRAAPPETERIIVPDLNVALSFP